MDDTAASSVCSLARILWHDREGAKSCSAIVFEQTLHNVKVSTTATLPLFSRVRLSMDGLEYLARVESAQVGDLGSEAELALQETRRLDERLAHRGAMRLTTAGDELPASIVVQALNYSSGGFQVRSDEPIEPDSRVRLTAHGIEYLGVTRYCHAAASGYRVGIQLVDEPTFDGF